MNLPHYPIEFVKEYRESVFKHFVEEYKQGLTPNPDILCNREIKFKVFFEKAMQLGADYLATGHYCQNLEKSGKRRLAKGSDSAKDQSYFTYTIKQGTLEKVLFPIGHLHKRDVRKIASKYNLTTCDKKTAPEFVLSGREI